MAKTAVVHKVDGDILAKAVRRVTPFMKADDSTLHSVFFEADVDLHITTTDGFRMAHVILTEIDFLKGSFVLNGDDVKSFADRHYNGEEIEVESQKSGFKLGPVVAKVVQGQYPDYRAAVPQDFDTMVVLERKVWVKAIRQHNECQKVGVVFNEEGCRLYFQNNAGETVAAEDVPVQMFSGPEQKKAYHLTFLHKALSSCDPSVTIKIGGGAGTLFESGEYWHLLAALESFPREVGLTKDERDVLAWAEEALKSVRTGDVGANVFMGGGKFYLELVSEDPKDTQILIKEPILAKTETPIQEDLPGEE